MRAKGLVANVDSYYATLAPATSDFTSSSPTKEKREDVDIIFGNHNNL